MTVVSHEIVEEIIKILQLNNKVIQLENFTEDIGVVVYQNGLIQIRNIDGNTELKLLANLEPFFLSNVLKQLIPKLKGRMKETVK